MLDDDTLRALAARISAVPGVVGVMLGGSRARGAHTPDSDVDLGLAGHPLGVPEFAYAGEIALGAVLADPTGELTDLHDATLVYPAALSRALVAGLWGAAFAVDNAAKAVSRADTTYVAGCLFRAVGLCTHALHGHAGVWLVNEKGAVAAAGEVACAPPAFTSRAHRLSGRLGTTGPELDAAVRDARDLVSAVTRACGAT